MSKRIAAIVKSLGLEKEGVVVSSGVLEALGIRPARDIDISVSAQTLEALRRQGNWEESMFADGRIALSRGPVEIFPDWSILDYQTLFNQANIIDGVKFASISQVYSWKLQANRPKDPADLAAIRQLLHSQPLDSTFLQTELTFIQSILPARFRNHPAVLAAANGLCMIRTFLGDKTAKERMTAMAKLFIKDSDSLDRLVSYAYSGIQKPIHL